MERKLKLVLELTETEYCVLRAALSGHGVARMEESVKLFGVDKEKSKIAADLSIVAWSLWKRLYHMSLPVR